METAQVNIDKFTRILEVYPEFLKKSESQGIKHLVSTAETGTILFQFLFLVMKQFLSELQLSLGQPGKKGEIADDTLKEMAALVHALIPQPKVSTQLLALEEKGVNLEFLREKYFWLIYDRFFNIKDDYYKYRFDLYKKEQKSLIKSIMKINSIIPIMAKQHQSYPDSNLLIGAEGLLLGSVKLFMQEYGKVEKEFERVKGKGYKGWLMNPLCEMIKCTGAIHKSGDTPRIFYDIFSSLFPDEFNPEIMTGYDNFVRRIDIYVKRGHEIVLKSKLERLDRGIKKYITGVNTIFRFDERTIREYIAQNRLNLQIRRKTMARRKKGIGPKGYKSKRRGKYG